jgi:hypothetical protein
MDTQGQGPNECFPTSVCMLYGVKWADLKPKVEAELTRAFGKPTKWGDTNGTKRDAAVDILFDKFFPEAPRNLRKCGRVSQTAIPRGCCPRMKVPSGRGIMVIFNVRHRIAHALAFEHGRVYDPAGGRVFRVSGFNDRYWGWRFDFAIRVPASGAVERAFRFIFPETN